MTGRDGGADLTRNPAAPVVILVRPQMGENIGAAARAMANGGLFDLRLVAPRDGWPQEKAFRMASGADRILEAASLHATVAEAVADLHRVVATCPRDRHVIKPLLTARGAAAELRAVGALGQRAGILFGPERNGLDNDDLARADTLVRFPMNPEFNSLNLGQAVLVMAYEWWNAVEPGPARSLATHETKVATKAQLENLMRHLLAELDACGFMRVPGKRPVMAQNLFHLFQRGAITEQEVRTLHGVVAELTRGRQVFGRVEPPDEE